MADGLLAALPGRIGSGNAPKGVWKGEAWELPSPVLVGPLPPRRVGWQRSSLLRTWRPEGGALGNNVNTATPPSVEAIRRGREEAEREREHVKRGANRRIRYSLKRAGQGYTQHSNVSKCGRVRRTKFGGEQAGVTLMHEEGRGAWFTGLCHCASVWECPTCSRSICNGRADELKKLATAHRATGGGAYMLTLTIPHDVGDDFRAMMKHVARAWSKVQAGAQYKRAKKKIGWVGSVAAREVTHGDNGWHPHLHVLTLTEKPLEHPASGLLGDDAEAYRKVVYDRWCNYITERNEITGKIYRKPSREHGVTLVPSHKDDYIAKMGLADEITRGSWKSAKDATGHRTPFQILRDIAVCLEQKKAPSTRDVALWREYGAGTRGMRQLTWSRGLRAKYDLEAEQTDLELAEQADAGGQVVCVIDDATWDRHFRNDCRLVCEVLDAAERGGEGAVRVVLDRVRGLEPVPF